MPVACQRNDAGRRSAFPESSHHLIAVHVRQADVEQNDLGIKALHFFQRFERMIDADRLVTVELEKHRKRIRRILIVVDNQHAPRRRDLIARRGFRGARRLRQRQAHFHGRARPGAVACGVHRSTVHFDQLFHHRQPDTETALRTVE